MKWFKDILTDDQGNFTPDKVGLVVGVGGWVMGLLAFLRIAWIAVMVKGQAFDPAAYGTGFAAIMGALGLVLAAGGGGMWLASRQKPTGGSQ